MVQEPPLSKYSALILAERISVNTMLRTEIFPYDDKSQWYWVVVYDEEGRVIDTLNNVTEGRELMRTYRRGQRNEG